jgi:hypothetical protein
VRVVKRRAESAGRALRILISSVELLADRSLLILKEAHQAGQTRRPDAERIVTQARRSVEKAISLLSRGS